MKLDLENKIALVTGGGRDIGKLISLNLNQFNIINVQNETKYYLISLSNQSFSNQ